MLPGIASLMVSQGIPKPGNAYVQFKEYDSTTDGTSHSVTFNSTATNGNLLILVVNAGATLNAITNWTKNLNQVNDTETAVYSKVSNGTESTITITATSSCTLQMVAIEFAGYIGTFDKSSLDTGGAGNNTLAFNTTAATTAANEIAIAVGGLNLSTPTSNVSPTVSWGSGFNQLTLGGAIAGGGPPFALMMGVAIKVLSSTGTVTTLWTFTLPSSTLGVWNSLIATYK